MKSPEQAPVESGKRSLQDRLRETGVTVEKAKDFPPRGECLWDREFCGGVAKWIIDGDRYCAKHAEEVANIILNKPDKE
jgi:hypothetical protein